ncbi:Myocardin [Cricetulus griseus]|uniref:Myocardin n=1 Tax=Cricetulus griseus TaxID=10029 RepID=G3GZ48_CRIGR|nr:Myocardin [Cricetulus griseus]
MKLKRARLADDLNEKIALRPGPLELVEKNILPMDSSVKEAIKGTEVSFSKSADAFAFEEDSSSDGLSPDQTRSEDPQGSVGSPPDIKAAEAPLAGPLDTIQVSELRQQLRIRGLPVSGTKTALVDRLRPFQDCAGNPVPNFGDITTVTFPVTPNTLPSYQSSPSGFYHFGSTSSSPPISPASSDLSAAGSLPDTFTDASPGFGLHAPTTILPKPSASFEQASSGGQISFDHYATDSDEHLEVLLNSHSPMGKVGDVTLLKIGNEETPFDGIMDGFPGKAAEDLFSTHELLPGPLSPMPTQLSPSSVDSSGLQLSFTESPWETMEWLDLTPPSSTPGFSNLPTSGPSIFNIDFLDVTDLNLNSPMDLHLQQW